MKLTKGIKFEDDPQYRKLDDERIELKADREKTNTQKGLDDLLFGSGAVRRGPRQPAVQKPTQVKPEQSKPQPKPEPARQPQPPTQTQPAERPFVKPDPPRIEPTQTTSKVPQKKLTPAEEAELQRMQTLNKGRQGYNRPAYIRKLKKIAQNFEFQSTNESNHTYIDVVRPYQCERRRIQLLESLHSEAGFFQDREFPASALSVGRNYRKSNIQWRRVEEFSNRPAFGKYVQPNDTQVGRLSCPSFVSVLSCLAQRQRNMKRVIESQQYNPNGFYYVRLNINGVWRYIAVDDFLPTLDGDNVGALSFRDQQSQISLSIIEKAYAKAYNGYDVFEKKCKPEHYLRDLTGSRVARYELNDRELIDHVQFSLEQNWTIVAVPNARIEELGLNSRYNLSIIGFGSRGFQIRNSWGTIVERPKINFSKEGVFELSIQEATKYFDYILVAQTEDKYHTTTVQSKHHAGFYSSYSFRIKESVEAVISASQWDLRLFPTESKYAYSPLRLIIQRRRSSQSSEYAAGAFTHSSRNIDILTQLTPGDYSVYCIGSWNKGQAFDYSLTFFGNHPVKFERNQTETFPNLISKSLQEVNLNEGKRSAKGHVDQYILYHEPTNLILLTNLNVSDKPYDYTQDLSRISFNTLNLLNGPNSDDYFGAKLQNQVVSTKEVHNSDRRWSIHLEPKQAYTWVISTSQDYNTNNFKNWGFK